MVAIAGAASLSQPQAQGSEADASQVYQEKLVVTASLEHEERRVVPGSVTVIERAEIRDRQATEIFEVLRTVPGLDIVQSGSPGKVVSLFSRGAESDQTLVLWNGVKLNDPFFAGFDWAFMPTDGVDRVEVVRGPFSSLYGSEAMGGVVQVFSARQDGGDLRLEGGSDSYGRLGVAWGAEIGSTQVDFSGHIRRGDGAAENDFYDGQSMMTRVAWAPGRDTQLGLIARFTDSEVGIPVASGVETPQRRQESDSVQLAVPFEAALGRWQISAAVTTLQSDFRFSDPDASFSLNRTDAERMGVRGVASYRAKGDFWFAFGADWDEDEVSNESNFGVALEGESRSNYSLFGEVQKAWGPVRLDLGVRQDEDQFFGGEMSPRIGVLADVSRSVQVFANYGEAFRAPSLGELFFPFFGNPDLEPETSESAEVGVRFDTERWGGQLAYFDNEFDNLIDTDPLTFTAINVGQAETSGLEVEVEYRYGMTQIRLNANFLDTEDVATGETLLRRPEESGSVWVAVRPGELTLSLTGRYVGERQDLDPLTFLRADNDEFFVGDLAATWQASSTVAPYVRIGNLLDEQYEEVLGFPSPGRSLVVGMEVELP
jgi:vitamin B12 transporter